MSEVARYRLTMTDMYLEDGRPFADVDELDYVRGDLHASVAGIPFPEIEVISSGELDIRQAMERFVSLRHIKSKTGSFDLDLFTTWGFNGKVERDHDRIFLTIKKGRTPVDGFDRVELSRGQVIEEISTFKKKFLEIATEKSSRRQAEELWESLTHEYVDEAKNNIWKW